MMLDGPASTSTMPLVLIECPRCRAATIWKKGTVRQPNGVFVGSCLTCGLGRDHPGDQY